MVALSVLAMPALVQAQFTFTTNNGAITITGYNTAAGLNVVIPAMTNGYPVTSIGDDAFENGSITGVTIPNSVTSIGLLALGNCTSLISTYFLGNAPPDSGNAFLMTLPRSIIWLARPAGCDVWQRPALFLRSAVRHQHPPFLPRRDPLTSQSEGGPGQGLAGARPSRFRHCQPGRGERARVPEVSPDRLPKPIGVTYPKM